MKVSAFILFLLVGFSTLEPALSYNRKIPVAMKCHKMMKCPKQGNSPDKERDNGCNPFMSCVYGNFYFAERNIFSFAITSPVMDKIKATNDNRLYTALSHCWHPPEPAS